MRPVPAFAGFGLLVGAWLGPFSPFVNHSFSAHMAVHMTVVGAAAPLLAYAIADGRFDPSRRVRSLFGPLLASAIELAIVWSWHTPALHDSARLNWSAYVLEQTTFLIAGIALWILSLGGGGKGDRARKGAGVVALLLTGMHMTLLGALLGLAPRSFYTHAHAATLTPLQDQHLGGAIMILLGGASYLGGGLWLSWGLMQNPTSMSPGRPTARPTLHA